MSGRPEYRLYQRRGEYGKDEIMSAATLQELREKIEEMEGGAWD